MKAFWRHMKHELCRGRDATLILAAVAGFIAWEFTQILKVIFS